MNRSDIVMQPIRPALHLRDRYRIARYLRSNSHRRLHIGAGANALEGWLNTNFLPLFRHVQFSGIRLDAAKRFPLPENSIDCIHSEHVIEHIDFLQGRNMVRECLRVLKPGGTLRISTPDLAFLVDLLKADLTPLQRDFVAYSADKYLVAGVPHTPVSVVNNYFRDWGHTYIYDRDTLKNLLVDVGFSDIAHIGIGQSREPAMCGIDHVDRAPPGFIKLQSQIIEATKAN